MRVPHGGDRPGRSPPLPSPAPSSHSTPPAERTHLFGSLMSNTDVTRDEDVDDVDGGGIGNNATPEESGFAAEEAEPRAFRSSGHLTSFLRAPTTSSESDSCRFARLARDKPRPR